MAQEKVDASKYKNCRVSKIKFSQNDRRDETKKMPLEVLFQKSSFRPNNQPKGRKMGCFSPILIIR